ncbi:MAG: YnbE family lipoprotein [Gammaproteobacteria bacterium]|nr:YnbE family lipoprotein [Gammaproteobacteria bacterium]
MKLQPAIAALMSVLWIAGCSPTVKMQAPDKPIEINMNVKIEHEIRVKVERDIEEMLEQNKDLF